MDTETKTVSDIDAAIAAARARKAARAGGEDSTKSTKAVEKVISKGTETTPEEKAAQEQERAEAKAKKDADRALKKHEKQVEREQKKTEREVARAKKKAAKAAERGTKKPHTSKLDKAKAKLPVLDDACKQFIELANGFKWEIELDEPLTSAQLIALAQHFEFMARSRQTAAALSTKLEVGQVVRITGGKDTRLIGKLATLQKVQRIRCYVEIPGNPRQIYLFTSDVTAVAPEEAESFDSTSTEVAVTTDEAVAAA